MCYLRVQTLCLDSFFLGFSVMGYGLWVICYGLSVFCFLVCVSKFVFCHEGAKARRFSVISYELSVFCYLLCVSKFVFCHEGKKVIGYRLSVMSYESWIMGYRLSGLLWLA